MPSIQNSKFPTSDDLIWLEINQPRLNLYETADKVLIKGFLVINHTYQEKLIKDKYKIRVEFEKHKNYKPVAREIGGRLEAVMEAQSVKSRADLHMYNAGNVCLMTPQQMNLVYLPSKSLKGLFDIYLIPYFYSQSYYEKNEGIWPWPHYPHNLKGILDWYIEHHNLAKAAKETVIAIEELNTDSSKNFLLRGKRRDSFNQNSKCICGSGRPYSRCDNRHTVLTKLAFVIRYQL